MKLILLICMFVAGSVMGSVIVPTYEFTLVPEAHPMLLLGVGLMCIGLTNKQKGRRGHNHE